MSGRARFDVVRGPGGEWFARFTAANGRQVWRTSETYKRRAGADNAIAAIAAAFHGNVTPDGKGVTTGGWAAAGGPAADIGYVDERDEQTGDPVVNKIVKKLYGDTSTDDEAAVPLEVES